MDTSLKRMGVGLANAKTRQGLTEAKLRELLPGEQAYMNSEPPRISWRLFGLSQAASVAA